MKRLNKATRRKRHRDFHAVMKEWLDANATRTEYAYACYAYACEYEIETKGGKLRITLHEDEHSMESGIYSVFCRFNDVEKARKYFGIHSYQLNPHSGKWNFHHRVADLQPQVFADFVVFSIKEILLTPTECDKVPTNIEE